MRLPLLQLFQHQATGGLREQLCTTLRLAISRPYLRADQQLPSTRQLAQDLNLSRVTVEAAYGQLESEGYLLRETGRGSFVAITMPALSTPPEVHQPAHFSACVRSCWRPVAARIRPSLTLLLPVRRSYALFLMTPGDA